MTAVAAAVALRVFSRVRMTNMTATMMVGLVIVGAVMLGAAAVLGLGEEWLRAFVVLGRSMGRLM